MYNNNLAAFGGQIGVFIYYCIGLGIGRIPTSLGIGDLDTRKGLYITRLQPSSADD
jgi:hypothetical protein